MAKIHSLVPVTPIVGETIPVYSFGHRYKATVLKVNPRTVEVTYTNKSGNVWTLTVKRNDVAAPTEAQQAATAQGKKTRQLRNNVRWATNELKWKQQWADQTIEQVNAERAESRRTSEKYGWRIDAHQMDITPERFAIDQAEAIARRDEQARKLEIAKAELAAHEALIKGGK